MKFSTTLAILLLTATVTASAQNETPKGFKSGTITLTDGSSVSGYIKDNMRNNASIVFLNEPNGKKKTYDGAHLSSIDVEGVKYVCIKNDFFKVLSEGELSFLQKSSDIKGKIIYYGTEPVIATGTDGKHGDYFILRNSSHELQLITSKNVNEVIATSFKNYSAAIEKAQTANGDLSQLKAAVDLYNKRTTN